jgi:hypothetical protein
LNDIEVLDLNFSGCFCIWTNKSEVPQFVARKLDRVLANEYWMSLFGRTIVEFLPGEISDHSLLLALCRVLALNLSSSLTIGWIMKGF